MRQTKAPFETKRPSHSWPCRSHRMALTWKRHSRHGGFHKLGYPQIIHLNVIFNYKPTRGSPIYGNPKMFPMEYQNFITFHLHQFPMFIAKIHGFCPRVHHEFPPVHRTPWWPGAPRGPAWSWANRRPSTRWTWWRTGQEAEVPWSSQKRRHEKPGNPGIIDAMGHDWCMIDV